MGTHDVFDVVVWVGNADSPVITQLLGLAVNDQQTDLTVDGHDECRQLVMLALLDVGVVHLDHTVSIPQARTLGRRPCSHLTQTSK